MTREERKAFWEELGAIKGLWEEPWCIRGDFNVTRFPYERSRRGRLNRSMRRFSEVIDELDLVDLPLLRGKFTWSGGLHYQNLAHLDHFLTSQDWLDHVGTVAQLKLSRPTSDHGPILLECGKIRRGKTPFRFENMWLKVEGFQDLLRGWWQGVTVLGMLSFSISRKLEEVKNLIKNWNKESFGRLETNKNLALNQLEVWDRLEEERGLTEEESEAKKEAKDMYKKWVLLEEMHWRQKSRDLAKGGG